jgi:hypothetical protein
MEKVAEMKKEGTPVCALIMKKYIYFEETKYLAGYILFSFLPLFLCFNINSESVANKRSDDIKRDASTTASVTIPASIFDYLSDEGISDSDKYGVIKNVKTDKEIFELLRYFGTFDWIGKIYDNEMEYKLVELGQTQAIESLIVSYMKTSIEKLKENPRYSGNLDQVLAIVKFAQLFDPTQQQDLKTDVKSNFIVERKSADSSRKAFEIMAKQVDGSVVSGELSQEEAKKRKEIMKQKMLSGSIIEYYFDDYVCYLLFEYLSQSKNSEVIASCLLSLEFQFGQAKRLFPRKAKNILLKELELTHGNSESSEILALNELTKEDSLSYMDEKDIKRFFAVFEDLYSKGYDDESFFFDPEIQCYSFIMRYLTHNETCSGMEDWNDFLKKNKDTFSFKEAVMKTLETSNNIEQLLYADRQTSALGDILFTAEDEKFNNTRAIVRKRIDDPNTPEPVRHLLRSSKTNGTNEQWAKYFAQKNKKKEDFHKWLSSVTGDKIVDE